MIRRKQTRKQRERKSKEREKEKAERAKEKERIDVAKILKPNTIKKISFLTHLTLLLKFVLVQTSVKNMPILHARCTYNTKCYFHSL